jgi:hypothetical protein
MATPANQITIRVEEAAMSDFIESKRLAAELSPLGVKVADGELHRRAYSIGIKSLLAQLVSERSHRTSPSTSVSVPVPAPVPVPVPEPVTPST